MDYLDVLLLHRPDLLFDPEQVAEAFDELEAAGKVRHFGVTKSAIAIAWILRHPAKMQVIAGTMITYCLKIVVFISAVIGTFLSAYAGRNSFMGSAWWILVLLIFLIIVGFIYLKVVDLLRKSSY